VNRPGELFTTANQLGRPPVAVVTRLNRLNRSAQVLFYAATTPNKAVYEIRAVSGDTVTVLLARTHSPFEELYVTCIGLERAKAPEFAEFQLEGMFRTSPIFRSSLGEGNYRKFV
jgi:hypothetical protein